jgi:transcription elongation GreA/GreB family factor
MQVPTRRAEKNPAAKIDFHLTPEKFEDLKIKLDKFKNVKRPRESAEVQRLALMGDFSENAGYQLAKSRLRGLNQRILEIENLLKNAEIIKPTPQSGRVELGNKVTVKINDRIKTYQILGSAETDPSSGIISHNSPLGLALINRRLGEIFSFKLGENTLNCEVLKID